MMTDKRQKGGSEPCPTCRYPISIEITGCEMKLLLNVLLAMSVIMSLDNTVKYLNELVSKGRAGLLPEEDSNEYHILFSALNRIDDNESAMMELVAKMASFAKSVEDAGTEACD